MAVATGPTREWPAISVGVSINAATASASVSSDLVGFRSMA
jgi:hypothetical protein